MKAFIYRTALLALVLVIGFAGIALAQKEEIQALEEKLREQSRQLAETARELSLKQKEMLAEEELFCKAEIEKITAEARRMASEQKRFMKEELMLGDIWHHHIMGGHPPVMELFRPGRKTSPDFRPERGGEFEKVKKFSKVYKVKASDRLDITNKFGKVHINTWNKNEVSVEVEMIVRASNEERAQQLLDRINIKENVGNGVVAIKTEYEQEGHVRGKTSFEINYTVSMPKNNPLTVKNSFGDVYVAELNGPANLDVKYGSLKTQKLNHNDNNVKVAFGSGDMVYMKQGDLKVSYSKLNLEGAEDLVIENAFSDLSLGNARNLQLQSKYGSVTIDKVESIQGAIGFSGFKLNKLADKVDLKVKYCSDFRIDEVGDNFKSINLNGSFSTFDLRFANNAGFNFDTNLSFGDLNVNDKLVNYNLVEKKSSTNSYKGTYGKKPGKSNVKIASKYSNVKFGLSEK